MADLDLSALEALHAKAFCAPWTHTTWAVECEQAEGDCTDSDGDRCDDYHDVETIESHDEYPNGQAVAQIDHTTPGEVFVPGLKTLAERNAEFICALRNAAPELLRLARVGQEVEALEDERDELRETILAYEEAIREHLFDVESARGSADNLAAVLAQRGGNHG